MLPFVVIGILRHCDLVFRGNPYFDKVWALNPTITILVHERSSFCYSFKKGFFPYRVFHVNIQSRLISCKCILIIFGSSSIRDWNSVVAEYYSTQTSIRAKFQTSKKMEDLFEGMFKVTGSNYSVWKSKMRDMLVVKDIWLSVLFRDGRPDKIDAPT